MGFNLGFKGLKYSVLIFVEKNIYIKCKIWRVAVRPSYIQDARFLKVKLNTNKCTFQTISIVSANVSMASCYYTASQRLNVFAIYVISNLRFFFYVHGSVHRESMSIIVQQDMTIYSLLYFCKLLYMFRVVTPPIIRSTYNCN